MARRRMDDEPGWLVDHDQMLVLVNHVELYVLADERRVLRRWRFEDDARPRGETHRRIARDVLVDCHLASLDQRLEPGARQGDAFCPRRLPQEPIEPLARALGVDGENLLPFGRCERSKGLGLRRPVFWLDLITRGQKALGAPLGLCIHARSRRRGRPPPVSAAGGATRGPSAATIASTSGRAPGLRASSPRRIAATWSGILPQQPPMMRAPQSTANSAYLCISSGVPE